jgi:uncharacterized membrane protein
MLNTQMLFTLMLGLAAGISPAEGQSATKASDGKTSPQDSQKTRSLTYTTDIAPVITKACLPCHAAESENPSGLSLDNYELMMKGGEHGKPVVAGKPDESSLFTKLSAKPPYGRQMPRKRPPLTAEEINLISTWISEGAKP